MAALHLYDIIVRPVVTEKVAYMNESGQYVFEVAMDANKTQVKEAVQTIFGKKVRKVNTMIMPAKRGQRGRHEYMRTSAWKKAIVFLEPGETIELFNV